MLGIKPKTLQGKAHALPLSHTGQGAGTLYLFSLNLDFAFLFENGNWMPTDLSLVFQVTLEDEIAVVIYFSHLERELPKFPTERGVMDFS